MITAPRLTLRLASAVGVTSLSVALALAGITAGAAAANPTTIDLGTAAAASVLGGSGVSNTGSSVLNGDVDSSPTPAIIGFPPGVYGGTEHAADGVAAAAQADLTTAYNAAAAAPSTSNETGLDLGGQTLTEGVYTASTAMALTGPVPLTLDGSASSVFIFQAGSTLITGSNTSIVLTGGVLACNVFWQVGTSATLGSGSSFVGNILANQSISLDTSATVQGRALARNGAVTLESNVFTAPACSAPTPPTPPTTTATTPTTSTPAKVATPVKAATPVKGATSTATKAGSQTGGGGGATVLGSASPTGALASTGVNVGPIAAGGAVLVGVGGYLLYLGRRRNTDARR
jgi:type VI secretion system secreted protein VgrG